MLAIQLHPRAAAVLIDLQPIGELNARTAAQTRILGGASDGRAYRAWIAQMARGIGGAPAIVILEPDALAGMGCLPRRLRTERAMRSTLVITIVSPASSRRRTFSNSGRARLLPESLSLNIRSHPAAFNAST